MSFAAGVCPFSPLVLLGWLTININLLLLIQKTCAAAIQFIYLFSYPITKPI